MSTSQSVHPNQALYAGGTAPTLINCCDHYAGSEKFIEKALALQGQRGPIFDITCDLEDGAGIGSENERREMALNLICSDANRFNLVGLRVNDYRNAAWQTDIREAVRNAGARLSHITIPKPESAAQVKEMLAVLHDACREANLQTHIPAHVLIETHGAVREAWQIAALDGVRGLDFGLMDFVSEHQGAIPSAAMQSPGQFEHALVVRAKTELSAAACAHGRTAAHNVSPQYSDTAQTRADAETARTRFGFTRMWSIHPGQIDAILQGMAPRTEEIVLAGEILVTASRAAWAPISHKHKLHDRASYRYYWGILKRAHHAGMTLDPEVLSAFFSDKERLDR